MKSASLFVALFATCATTPSQAPAPVPSLSAAAASTVKHDDDRLALGGMTTDPHEHVADEDQLAIRGVIRTHEAELQPCFAKAPDAHGRVTVQFEIGEGGAVASALAQNTTLHARNVEDCIVGAVKSWQFDKPKRGRNVTVSFPFSH
jgi:outer membrane biosynthesis protein TonB